MDKQDIKISKLEHTVINFCTPPLYVVIKMLDRETTYGGIVEQKKRDYIRLVEAIDSNEGKIPSRVMPLYCTTFCGMLMLFSGRYLRKYE